MHAIESPDAAERFIKTHRCAQCQGRLSVAWGGGFGVDSWVIRCSRNPKHEGMEHNETGGNMTQAIQKFEPKVGLAILERQYGAIVATERETEIRKLTVLLEKGFDPALHLMVYEGRLAVKIDGMYWWRDRDKRFARMISEPIDPALKGAYGLEPDEIGVITRIFVKGIVEAFCTGFGKASMRSYTYRKGESAFDHPDRKRNPIDAKHPYRMAEKRAENQAIRKFHPLGVEVETPEEMVEGEAHLVDTEIGELQEPPVKATALVAHRESSSEAPARPQVSPQAPEAPPSVQAGPVVAAPQERALTQAPAKAPVLKTVTDLLSQANRRYGVQKRALEELLAGNRQGFRGVNDLATSEDLAWAWGIIQAAYEQPSTPAASSA